jgi:hypothetical protein
MKKRLSIAACMIATALATPCMADDDGIPLRTIPPFHPRQDTCLSVYYNGATAYWLNHCPYAVSVRWDDEAKCRNWSCVEEVPADSRSTATISRHVRWCECRGTLATCNLPTTGC